MPRAARKSIPSNGDARGTLPPGLPAWITPELVERTLAVWQPYYDQPLSVNDAIEILRSCERLIAVLRA